MKRIMKAAALAVLAAAGPLAAQQNPTPPPPPARAPAMPGMAQQPGAPGRRQGMMGGMMGLMGMAPHGAREILAMGTALGLSPAQLQQLQTIAMHAMQAARPHMQAALQAHQAATQAMEAETPDVARFQTELQSAANHFVEAQVALAHSGVAALAVLTPEQRANVRFAMRLEHARMMQEPGGMPGMPGMGRPGARPMPGMPHDTAHSH